MSEQKLVEVLEKLVAIHEKPALPWSISHEEYELLKTILKQGDGLIIDKSSSIPQGATFYEVKCLFVSPKGKLLIKKFREHHPR